MTGQKKNQMRSGSSYCGSLVEERKMVSVFGLVVISHESRVLSIVSITCMKQERENEAEQGAALNRYHAGGLAAASRSRVMGSAYAHPTPRPSVAVSELGRSATENIPS